MVNEMGVGCLVQDIVCLLCVGCGVWGVVNEMGVGCLV